MRSSILNFAKMMGTDRTGVCKRKHSLHSSVGHATQWRKLLSKSVIKQFSGGSDRVQGGLTCLLRFEQSRYSEPPALQMSRLRTDGVNTNGAAAKVMIFDRLGKKVRPGTFGEIKVGQQEYLKSPSVKKCAICSDPH